MTKPEKTTALCMAALVIGLALSAGFARAADPIGVEIHEWTLWIVDPTLTQANAKDQYPNNLPVFVESVRSRLSGRDENRPSPLGMMTFYGEPATGVEVEMQLAASSRFLAHWPPAESKSKRVRWLELSLAKAPGEAGRIAPAESDHWFGAARAQDEALYVSQGARTERFLCYDVETSWMPSIKLTGGPDKYQLTNLGKLPLEDVLISVAAENGRRIGQIAHVPAGSVAEEKKKDDAKPAEKDKKDAAPTKEVKAAAAKAAAVVKEAAKEAVANAVVAAAAPAAAAPAAAPAAGAVPQPPAASAEKKPPAAPSNPAATVEVAMSAVLSPESPEFAEQSRTALRKVLLDAGLKTAEADLFLSLYADAIFKSKELVVLFRLSSGAIEEQFPVTTYPEVKRIVRVPLVLVRNIDPQLQRGMEALVVQLGDESFKTRQAAEKRLLELGRLAIPLLKEALKNKDPEVVYRAERLLLSQKESIDGSAANLAAPPVPPNNGVLIKANP